MVLLATLGIISIGTVIGTSVFLFRRRPRESFRLENQKKEVITLTLRGLNDVDMICETIDKGNVVILGVKDLTRLDIIRLKRSIQQLKAHARETGADIFMLGKEFVVLVPSTMKFSFIKNLLEEAQDNVDIPDLPTEADTYEYRDS